MHKLKILGFVILLFLLTNSLLFSQDFKNIKGNIVFFGVSGIEYSPKSKILSLINQNRNRLLTNILVVNMVKELYALGLFDDIQVTAESVGENQVKLNFHFVEKGRIDSISFQGNSKLSEKKLLEAIQTKQFDFIDEVKIQIDIKRIIQAYIQEGYSKVKVLYRWEKEKNKRNLVFQILESRRSYLTKIKIKGSKYFLPIDLERKMQSSEIDCFSWVNQSGRFDEQKISTDLQIISQAYFRDGFIDVEISKPKIIFIISAEFTTVEISFDVKEGKQYFINTIEVQSLDEDQNLLLPKEEILEKIKLKTGDPYNIIQQGSDRSAVNSIYQDLGYAFSVVQVKRNIDRENQLVDLLFEVQKREKIYINRIEFYGNRETRDNILRRELTIYDGELFNGQKIRKSLSKIGGLGYFVPQVGVRYSSQLSAAGNEANYNIQLQEAQTGSISGGLSYSTSAGLGINFSISKSNFLGTGRRIALNVDKQENTNSGRISFTEPYFWGSKWRSTTSLNTSFEDKDANNKDYDTNTEGWSQGFSYPIWPRWSLGLSYAFSQTRYSEFTATPFDNTESHSLTNSWSYSTVNHPQFPSDGASSSFSVTEAGGFLGGNANYRRATYEFKFFQSLPSFPRIIFYYRFRARKLAQNTDKLIPTGSRFLLGGTNSIRGFESSEIRGPASPAEQPPEFSVQVLTTDDRAFYNKHIYGNEELLNNFEILFPLTREGYRIRGVIFYDAGNVFAEDRVYDIVGIEKDYTYLRQSYGVGVRMITPLGILKFEYGTKINPKPSESPGKFEFTIGSLF